MLMSEIGAFDVNVGYQHATKTGLNRQCRFDLPIFN